jgi:Protein of unknown function (DUF4031)
MIYVDDMLLPSDVQNGPVTHHSRWSHLYGDNTPEGIEELHRFAARLGLKREWFQGVKTLPHYDLTAGKRMQALSLGAQPVSWRRTGEESARRREAARDALAREAGQGDGRRLLVTASRTWTDKARAQRILGPYFAPDVTLVVGGAAGGDTLAAFIWREWGGQVEEHPVSREEWAANPGRAGHARNGVMVGRGAERAVALMMPCEKPECVAAEPHGTHGTADCIRRAEQAGIPVEVQGPDTGRSEERCDDISCTEHPGGAGPAEQPQIPQRHSWAKGRGHTRACRNCDLVALTRPLKVGGVWLTTYARDGRRFVAGRVPQCGAPDAEQASAEQLATLADAADRAAGEAYQRRDFGQAERLIQDGRALAPEREALWRQREAAIRKYAGKDQARQAEAPATEPDAGAPGQAGPSPDERQASAAERLEQQSAEAFTEGHCSRAAEFWQRSRQADPYRRLAHEMHAGLEKAGIPPDDPGLAFVTGWNELQLIRLQAEPADGAEPGRLSEAAPEPAPLLLRDVQAQA